MEKTKIAVLLTCHNRKNKTIQCLESLFCQKDIGLKFELTVFLVDDGSTDGTSKLITQLFADVNVIKGDGNLYWNRGMHKAWGEAEKYNFPFYLWLNDDTILFDTAILELLGCAQESNYKALICGATRSSKECRVTYGGRTQNAGLLAPNGSMQPCDYFNGNCVLVPIHVFNILGNLDYSFHHALGDYDYGLRAKKHGIKAFASKFFIGTCEKHESLPQWCSPSVQFFDRVTAFRSPLGINPIQFFRFEKRHYGIMLALYHFISIHVRLILPGIWIKRSSY